MTRGTSARGNSGHFEEEYKGGVQISSVDIIKRCLAGVLEEAVAPLSRSEVCCCLFLFLWAVTLFWAVKDTWVSLAWDRADVSLVFPAVRKGES